MDAEYYLEITIQEIREKIEEVKNELEYSFFEGDEKKKLEIYVEGYKNLLKKLEAIEL